MKAEELRIGNWVKVDDLPEEQVTLEMFKTLCEMPATIGFFRGIPLTREKLIELGFKNSEYAPDYYYHELFDRIYVRFLHYNFIFGNKLGDIVPIDKVHKLQNLFYAFTETELTIKS